MSSSRSIGRKGWSGKRKRALRSIFRFVRIVYEMIPTACGLAVPGEDQESLMLLNNGISRAEFSDKTLTNETELVSIGITENTVKQLALGEGCIRLLRYVDGSCCGKAALKRPHILTATRRRRRSRRSSRAG